MAVSKNPPANIGKYPNPCRTRDPHPNPCRAPGRAEVAMVKLPSYREPVPRPFASLGKLGTLHQSEGFPLTGYFVPACVGRWAWPGQKNCRRAVAVAVVGVIFLNARFSEEKLHKMMFVWRIEGVAMI